ncbi:Ada metal-binding domain-containing protein [Emticicia aquatilis]|uniref:Ada metal-binding domain-containing protein n=1 Tax=Emticicia aquatilis TaxID=1537369 RepID=UPI00166F301D|nr:Ada metal-binding domain-containing protein [Emticicia aquatilis]
MSLKHIDLGKSNFERSRNLFLKIESGEISLGGNRKLKIFGRLDCRAGKRMKVENRVFFQSEAEAINLGYRPCAICMRSEYLIWKGTI